MKTTTVATFNLSKLTEADLFRLAAECMIEQERRRKENEERRSKWIESYYYAFLNNPCANVIHVGETTVIAFWNRTMGLKMGTATPVRGDVFDYSTGIAVAYAKAIGDSIPNYI